MNRSLREWFNGNEWSLRGETLMNRDKAKECKANEKVKVPTGCYEVDKL